MIARGNNQERKMFVLGKNPKNENEYMIYNLETGKSINVDNKEGFGIIYGSKYLVYGDKFSSDQSEFTFYSQDLEKLSYSVSKDTYNVYSLNDKWIIKQDKNTKQLYLVDITNGEEKELDIKVSENDTIQASNATSIVIKNNSSYKFYRIK